MELFGSAAGDNCDPSTSDLDFLVTFEDLRPNEYAEAYFGLLEALRELFQKPIDLVVPSVFSLLPEGNRENTDIVICGLSPGSTCTIFVMPPKF